MFRFRRAELAETNARAHSTPVIDAGFDDHVVKPISLQALIELIG